MASPLSSGFLHRAFVGVIAAVAVGSAATAHAALITFASFQTDQGSTPIISLDGSGDLSAYTGTASVLFYFTSPTVYSAQQTLDNGIPATLTLSATLAGPATIDYVGPTPAYVTQPISNLTFTFTAVTPVAGEPILLKTVATTGQIEGPYGDVIGNTDGSTLSADAVDFSSDVLSFSNAVTEQYNVTLNDITPALTTSDGQLAAFIANATGSFDVDTAAVPEPASLSVLALSGLPLLLRRRR